MYDTLLQMGRWFGYRPNYGDVAKVWMTPEAIDWYGQITRATAELKEEISKMRNANQTPRDFGLKVRQDPGALIVTARNKMRTATDLTCPVTVSGNLLETPRLKASKNILASNETAFKNFVNSLSSIGDRFFDEERTRGHYYWKNVPGDNIAQLLLDFETNPWHLSFNGRALAVDMSWTLCYVSAEFACNQQGKRVDLSGIKPIDEAARLLRSAERNVTAPTAENNPFEYLKMMCPEFIPAFDQIIDFWNDFSDSEIRRRYNFCKHKGRPAYQEIEELSSGRVMGFYVQNKDTGEKIQMASDISDVRYSFSLEDAIVQLVDFDDNKLFPYIRKLIDTLEDILEPSPMI